MLREETVEPATLELLKKITSIPDLSHFRLVGGTALSLLYGHRKSIDLDLFTTQNLEKETLSQILNDSFISFTSLENKSKAILQCYIQGIKVDFVSLKDEFIHLPDIIDTIPFAHIEDLGALKLNAIKGRGAKKDFWDIEKLLQYYSLDNLLNFYQKRYPYDDTFAVMRSIVYFADADEEPDPELMEIKTWEEVKKNIKKAFEDYYNQKLNKK
jgi:predicted nucleotidyltransferase component of viral defense system